MQLSELLKTSKFLEQTVPHSLPDVRSPNAAVRSRRSLYHGNSTFNKLPLQEGAQLLRETIKCCMSLDDEGIFQGNLCVCPRPIYRVILLSSSASGDRQMLLVTSYHYN
jgi:hypothetical protein